MKESAVITAQDVDTIYDVPLAFHDQGLDELIVSSLQLTERAASGDLTAMAKTGRHDSRAFGRRNFDRDRRQVRRAGRFL